MVSYDIQPWLRLAGDGEVPRPLVWLMAGKPEEEQIKELFLLLEAEIRQGCCPPCALAGCVWDNWNDDYSPWPLELPDGRRFGGQASERMQLTMMHLLPEVQSRFCCDGRQFAVGYSLGGLAALYYASHGGWDGCASCSGSLWYPGFSEWFSVHQPSCPVYFSLGGREKNTSDPLMAQVEERTQRAYEQLRPAVKTAFVHEPGGHFRGTAQRLLHAINWLLHSEIPANRRGSA